MNEQRFDVVVCGGGLAGLTFALQLRREVPEASVTVIERVARPLPQACHKVGESSVELGSHYFGETVGLGAYLKEEHLFKNGLRFFCGDTQGSIAARPEIGPAEFPIVPSFQIDRGKFENDVRGFCEEAGVTLLEGWQVSDIELSESGDEHIVLARPPGGEPRPIGARWVVDATGRRRLIQMKRRLARPSPNTGSAAWFRVAGRVKIGDLVPETESAWHGRDVDGNRWLSTVHLMGRGYWVWLIPLSTGFTSVGIVADEGHHPWRSFGTPDAALAWLAAHEPVVAERLSGHPLEDFRAMRRYSYLSEQVFSAHRWACIGEAGIFVDPLYSLGSDFIGLGNSFTARLVADDLRGELDPAVVDELNAIHHSTSSDAALTLSGNGDIFPHADIFGAKLWWDFYNYWSFFTPYFVQGIYRLPLDELRRFRAIGAEYRALNELAQGLLATWASIEKERPRPTKPFVPLPMFPSVLASQHVAVTTERTPDEAFSRMQGDLEVGRALVAEIAIMALKDLGPVHAARFGLESGLVRAPELIGAARLAADERSRRDRREALPPIGRDFERAFGRHEGSVPLRQLLAVALGRPELTDTPAAALA